MNKRDNFTVVLVGLCGTGKSIIGEKVAKKLGLPFYDADILSNNLLTTGEENSQANSHEWLSDITGIIKKQYSNKGCVISCSILQKEQRKLLSQNVDNNIDWVFMNGSYEAINKRLVQGDSSNQTKTSLESDFKSLEIPKRALTIDISNTDQEIVDTILKYLARKYG